MPSSSAVRPTAAALAAVALPLPLLTAVAPTSVGAEAAGSAPAVAEQVVRLVSDPGSPVKAAETSLAAGRTRVRSTSYSQVAATWRGPAPRVSVRTEPGQPWQRLGALADGPDPGSAEAGSGLRGTDLLWTGPHTGLDVRVRGSGFRDLRLVLIDPGTSASDSGPAPVLTPPPSRAAKPDSAPPPRLRTRPSWGADDSWRNGRPSYVKRLKQVHVHHTATSNDYSRRDVPAIIRGMYRYHTKTLGWFDIGYNFLVDRFGRAWIGRSGGPKKLVRGAHTLGFNDSSVGIAMIGNLDDRRPWPRAVRTLRRLAAWKLDDHGLRATGKVRVRSTGSDKYPDGRRVRLPVIDGHRDTNDTACPGQRLYNQLPAIRRDTQGRMDRFQPPR